MNRELMFLLLLILTILLFIPVVQADCGCNCADSRTGPVIIICTGDHVGCMGGWASPGYSSWQSCTINPITDYCWGDSGSSCDTGNSKCHTGYCPSYPTNRVPCEVDYDRFSLTCVCDTEYGIWDASDGKCVTCSGKTEQYNMADTSDIYPKDNPGDGQCESACWADDDCDERYPDSSWCDGNYAKSCDSTCTYSSDYCPPYICSGGLCLDECTKDLDCATGYVCDLNKNQCKRCNLDHIETHGDSPEYNCESADLGVYSTSGNRGSWCTAHSSCDEKDPGSTWVSDATVCNWCTSTCDYGSDSSKPSTYYESGGHCYYGCTVTCGVGGWSRSGCTDDGTAPSDYYTSDSTCYYGCTASCTSTGWQRTGCSSTTCKCSGCSGYCSVGNTCYYNDACTSSGETYNSCLLNSEYSCSAGGCIDTNPPTTTINPDGISWVNYDVSFTLTCVDAGSGCANTYYKIIDDGQSCGATGYSLGTSGTVSCSAGSVCTKRVCFYSTDNAGNIESTKQSNIFYIDKANPIASVISPTTGSWQNETFFVGLFYSDNIALSTCEYRKLKRQVGGSWDNPSWASLPCSETFYSTSITVSVGLTGDCNYQSTDGSTNTCRVEVRATDIVGNTNSGSRDWRIDYTPPTSIITDPDISSWQNEDFNVTVSDSDTGGSGLKTCYYQVYSFDGVNWVQTRATTTRVCNDNVTLTVSSIGDCRDQGTDTCNITVWAEDNANNVGLLDSRLFSIDWTPPPIINIVHLPPQPTDVDVVTYNGTADDGAGSGLEEIRIYVDSGAGYSLLGSPCTSPPSPCERQQGPYNEGDTIWYYANATDKAGNEAQSAIKSFTVISAHPIFITFQLSGDMNYLNAFWNAKYKAGFDKPLGVNCTLNPLARNQQCIPFPFIQDPNSGTCAVPNPQYEFSALPSGEGAINNVSCVLYDPDDVRVSNLSIETFKPIAFEVSVSPAITTTVGEPFSLPINVRNLGLLTDNYTVEIIPFSFPNLVSIERNYSTITNVKTGEIGSTYARVNLLATIQALIIRVNVTSATSCQHAPQCISKTLDITIKGGMYSLPEFDFIGVIQIITIAVLVFCVINLKKKMYL